MTTALEVQIRNLKNTLLCLMGVSYSADMEKVAQEE